MASSGDAARFGLSVFPERSDNGEACVPANAVVVPLPPPTDTDDGGTADLWANAARIDGAIAGAGTGGGTPTAASIAFLGTQPGLQLDDNRAVFFDLGKVLLLTDGLPNCDADNPKKTCGDPSARCTCLASCPTGKDCCAHDNSATCAKGCLDDTNAAAIIGRQRTKGIRTIVLAFGGEATEATGDAPNTLTAMATAGGGTFRKCPHGDSDCDPTGKTGDVCTAGLCKRQYFTANSAAELAAALADISKSIVDPEACTVPLPDQPTSAEYVAVVVNGRDVPHGPSTWKYDGAAIVFAFASPYCQAILNQRAGYSIEVRYLQIL